MKQHIYKGREEFTLLLTLIPPEEYSCATLRLVLRCLRPTEAQFLIIFISFWLNNRFFSKAIMLKIMLRKFDFSGVIMRSLRLYQYNQYRYGSTAQTIKTSFKNLFTITKIMLKELYSLCSKTYLE